MVSKSWFVRPSFGPMCFYQCYKTCVHIMSATSVIAVCLVTLRGDKDNTKAFWKLKELLFQRLLKFDLYYFVLDSSLLLLNSWILNLKILLSELYLDAYDAHIKKLFMY